MLVLVCMITAAALFGNRKQAAACGLPHPTVFLISCMNPKTEELSRSGLSQAHQPAFLKSGHAAGRRTHGKAHVADDWPHQTPAGITVALRSQLLCIRWRLIPLPGL